MWQGLWPFMCARDILAIRVTAKAFDNEKMYGPHADLFLFLPRNATTESDPTEQGHTSMANPIFAVAF